MPYTGSHQPFPREKRPEWRRLNRAFLAQDACTNAYEDKLRQGGGDEAFAPQWAEDLCEVWSALIAAGLDESIRSEWNTNDPAEVFARGLLLCAGQGAVAVATMVAREPELANPDFFHVVRERLGNFGWTLLQVTRHRFSSADIPEVISALKGFLHVVEQSPTGSYNSAARAARPALTDTLMAVIAALHPSDPPNRPDLKPGERVPGLDDNNEDLYDPDLPPASALALHAAWPEMLSPFRDRGRGFPLTPPERLEWLDLIDRTLKTLAEDKGDDPPTVWYHGGKSYSPDGVRPIHVSNEQHNVLKAFLDSDEARNTGTFFNTGASNVTTVMKSLVKKLGEVVRWPKNKGDGYFIRVRTLKTN